MKKFFVVVAVCFASFFVLIYSFDFRWLPDRALTFRLDREPCPFCEKENYEKQVVFEGDRVWVLLNYMPIAEGHILIIPKRHVERFEDLSPEEFVEMGQMIALMQKTFTKVYGKPDYVLVVQNGHFGGQTVNHAHIHMIPRGEESTLMMKVQLWNTFLTEILGFRGPLPHEEQQLEIEKIQNAIINE